MLALVGLLLLLLGLRDTTTPPTFVTPGEPRVARQVADALAGGDAETVLTLAGHLVPGSQHEQIRQEAAQQRARGWLHRVRLAGCVIRWDGRTECAYLLERWPVGAGERQYVRWWISLTPDGRIGGVE